MNANRHIQKLAAYPLSSHKAWDEPDKGSVLKLDWNEADLEPPAHIKQAISDFITTGCLNWYPDVHNNKLLERIADYSQVPQSHVQYFCGEDSALDYLVRTYVDEGDQVAIVSPTYDNFRVFVEAVGGKIEQIRLPNIFEADVTSLQETLVNKYRLVYLVNPNNPTGAMYTKAEVESVVAAFPGTLFIIDEAYVEFVGDSCAALVEHYDNVVVGRSFSKAFGLASFRVGYLLADPSILSEVNKIRNGKNISALGQVATIAALEKPEYMQAYVNEVAQSKAYLVSELQERTFAVKETPANFILVQMTDPKKAQQALQEKGVYVRSLAHLSELEPYLRITVGRKASSVRLLEVIDDLIQNERITPAE